MKMSGSRLVCISLHWSAICLGLEDKGKTDFFKKVLSNNIYLLILYCILRARRAYKISVKCWECGEKSNGANKIWSPNERLASVSAGPGALDIDGSARPLKPIKSLILA